MLESLRVSCGELERLNTTFRPGEMYGNGEICLQGISLSAPHTRVLNIVRREVSMVLPLQTHLWLAKTGQTFGMQPSMYKWTSYAWGLAAWFLGARNLGVTSISMGKILSHCLRAPVHLWSTLNNTLHYKQLIQLLYKPVITLPYRAPYRRNYSRTYVRWIMHILSISISPTSPFFSVICMHYSPICTHTYIQYIQCTLNFKLSVKCTINNYFLNPSNDYFLAHPGIHDDQTSQHESTTGILRSFFHQHGSLQCTLT